MKILCLFSFLWFALFSTPAIAFNLNSDDTFLYAQESIQDEHLTSEGYLRLESTSNELNIEFELGFSLTARAKFVRIDFANGSLDNALSSEGLVTSLNYESILVAGGAAKDTFAIVEISATSTLENDALLSFDTDSLYWFDYYSPLVVTYTLYDSVVNALNEESAILNVKADLALVTTGFSSEYSHSFQHAADIGHSFLRFVETYRSPETLGLGDASESLAVLAKFIPERLIADDVRDVSTSSLIADYRSVIPNRVTGFDTASISGNFQHGELYLNDSDDCSGVSLSLEDDENTGSIALSLDNLEQFPVLCMNAQSNQVVIERTEYYLDTGLGLAPSLFGKIYYDAAYFDLPYLTNYARFRQRLIMVNHSDRDVIYQMEFTSESAVSGNYSISDLEQGVLPAKASITINSSDLFEIESGAGNRLNARVYLDAYKEDVAVATQVLVIEDASNIPPVTNLVSVQEPDVN